MLGLIDYGEGSEQVDYLAKGFSDIAQMYGLDANVAKQRLDRYSFTYLQRYFDIRYRRSIPQGKEVVTGAYPTVQALNSAMYPERFHDSRK